MSLPTPISRERMVLKLAEDGRSVLDHAAAAIMHGTSVYVDSSGQSWRVPADHEQLPEQPASASIPSPKVVVSPASAKDLGDLVADAMEAQRAACGLGAR
jgi:hypothetical protein